MAGYRPVRERASQGAFHNDGVAPARPRNFLFPPPTPAPAKPHIGNALYGAESIDLTELRRQQAVFHRTVADQDRQNWPVALAALLPTAALFAPIALETGVATLDGAAIAVTRKGPLRLTSPAISQTRGENFYARQGREIHKIFDARFEAKGWKAQKAIEGSRLKPDGTIFTKTPGAAEDRFYLELKPNTPSGRAAGARQIRKYLEANEQAKGRVLYYDPKDFYP